MNMLRALPPPVLPVVAVGVGVGPTVGEGAVVGCGVGVACVIVRALDLVAFSVASPVANTRMLYVPGWAVSGIVSCTEKLPSAPGVTVWLTMGVVLLSVSMETVRVWGGSHFVPVTVTCPPGASVFGLKTKVASLCIMVKELFVRA